MRLYTGANIRIAQLININLGLLWLSDRPLLSTNGFWFEIWSFHGSRYYDYVSPVVWYQVSEEPIASIIRVKDGGTRFLQTFARIHQTTKCHIPGDLSFNTHSLSLESIYTLCCYHLYSYDWNFYNPKHTQIQWFDCKLTFCIHRNDATFSQPHIKIRKKREKKQYQILCMPIKFIGYNLLLVLKIAFACQCYANQIVSKDNSLKSKLHFDCVN
jgi:hypothetical protein